MADRPKTLVIVEGKKTEPVLFRRMATVFGMDMDVYAVGGNIYAIYRILKSERFEANVKDVAAELSGSEADRAVLSQDFADTFLVFDCDPHHTDDRSEAPLPIGRIVERNFGRILEMARHLDDSTDPTKGKLFVNYPMMEAFRDCDDFFDPAFERTDVPIREIASYKRRVSGRKLSRLHPGSFSRDQFERLLRMNAFKLSSLNGTGFGPVPYETFLRQSGCGPVAQRESELVRATGRMPVLCTSLFLPVDYFGNKDGSFDRIAGLTAPR